MTVLTLSVATVQGQSKNGYKGQSRTGKLKYGLNVGLAIASSSYEGFCEYQVAENFGIKSGLSYDRKTFFIFDIDGADKSWAVATPRYVSLPIIARFYPGDRQRFCIFLGLQPRYLVGGEIDYRRQPDSSASEEEGIQALGKIFERKDGIKINDGTEHPTEINKMHLGFVLGFDHEYRSGFMLGLKYGRNFTQIMKYDRSFLDWIFQLGLGYNFAKLID